MNRSAGSWRDPSRQASLENDVLRAEFQSGLLCRLVDRITGQILLSRNSEDLPGTPRIFAASGQARRSVPQGVEARDESLEHMGEGPSENRAGSGGGIDLDGCETTLEATDHSVVGRFRAADTTRWENHWSIESGTGDLVLRTTVRTAEPIGVFRMPLPGWAFRDHKLVLVNVTGTGLEQSPPWVGEQRTSVPVALFQGEASGWFLEARELDIGTASISVEGRDGEADVSFIRTYPVVTRAPGPVEIRVRAYHGDWQDAVDPYLAWMADEAGFVPIDRMSQQWVKQIRTQAYLYPWDFEGLERLAGRLDPAKTFLGRVTDFTRERFPNYTPSAVCRKWFQRARDLGFHVGAHVNTTSISLSNQELVDRFYKGFLEIRRDEHGNETWEGDGPAHAGRVTANTPEGPKTFFGNEGSAYCSPALEEFRGYFVEALRPLVDAGVDIIYLDECGGVGRSFIEGMTSTQGVIQLQKQILEAYPQVVLQTEQFNPVISMHAGFALTTLDPGHPLSGYLFSRFIKIAPEWYYHEPTDVKHMDEHQSWGFMLPGASWNESWLAIAEAFQTFDLEPAPRLPLGPGQLSGFQGAGGVKAFYEKQDGNRGLVLYESGKDPKWVGTRVTGTTTWPGPGALPDWPFYDGQTILALNPDHTYAFDERVTLPQDRFHVTSVPAGFSLYSSEKQRIIPIEIGEHAAYYKITFTGHGDLSMRVPSGWMVYLDDEELRVDAGSGTAHASASAPPDHPSVLLAFESSDRELVGEGDGLPWANPVEQRVIYWNQCYTEACHYAHRNEYAGILVGRLPEADRVLMRASGDGLVRVNGKPIANLKPGGHHEADLSAFSAAPVLIEFSADGGQWPEHRRPPFFKSVWAGHFGPEHVFADGERSDFDRDARGAEIPERIWSLTGGWSVRIVAGALEE